MHILLWLKPSAMITTGAGASSGCEQLWSQANAEDTQTSGEARCAPGGSSGAVLPVEQGSPAGGDQGGVPGPGGADDCLQPPGAGHAVW